MVMVKAKSWGNSLGVIIPKDVVNDLKIKEGEELVMNIEKKQNVLKELFGTLKFSKTTKEILKEARKDLEGKWMK